MVEEGLKILKNEQHNSRGRLSPDYSPLTKKAQNIEWPTQTDLRYEIYLTNVTDMG